MTRLAGLSLTSVEGPRLAPVRLAQGHPPIESAPPDQALRARDIGAVFRYVQQYAGASQAKTGAAVDLTQARATEVINGRREVSRLNVYERTANGLGMPDDARHLLGPAASRDVRHGGQAMKIRGKVAAVALVLGAAVAGAVLLWPTGKDTPAAPTHEQISEQIKASAGAMFSRPIPVLLDVVVDGPPVPTVPAGEADPLHSQ